MKHISEFIFEQLQFPEVVKDHFDNNISLSESYLRLDSDSYAELLQTARKLYENGEFKPTSIGEQLIVEKLNSGDKAIFKGDGKNRQVKLDIPAPNPSRTEDGKRFIVFRKTDKVDEESGLPFARAIKFGSWDGAGGNLDINNDDPKAVKSFWARQNCDSKKDPESAGFWACYSPEMFGDVLKLRGGKERW